MYWSPVNPIRLLILIVSMALCFACAPKEQKQSNKPLIVCTTGMIGDAVKNIVGVYAEVSTIMGPGVDPHLYKATHGDLVKFQEADIVVYNGLHLEGKLGEVLKKVGAKRPIIAIAEKLDTALLINNSAFQGTYDPHIWFDVSLWNQALGYLTADLEKELNAPEEAIRDMYSQYASKLDSLHASVKEQISRIPAQQRKLITAHDAFAYFGRAYGIEVKGLQGISTLSEFGLRDVSELVDFIAENKIPSIYTETSVSEKSIEAVLVGVKARGVEVKLGGSLYSDAMGKNGTPEGTYIGMVEANVQKIVAGLGERVRD